MKSLLKEWKYIELLGPKDDDATCPTTTCNNIFHIISNMLKHREIYINHD